MINDRAIWSFNVATHRLEKSLRKKVRRRFSFICENVLECVPLSVETAAVGIDLIEKFALAHNIKSSLRNSVNDMMILATAMCCREDLFTKDSLLSRFAAEAAGAQVAGGRKGLIRINFSARSHPKAAQSSESKGYINRGWRVAEEARRAPQLRYYKPPATM
jgi:hypothetical protein